MANLIAKTLPKVSREFALELRKVFRPIGLTPDMSRDKIYISVGEQRVIDYILRVSSNQTFITKVEEVIEEVTDNSIPNIIEDPTPRGKSWMNVISNRFSGS